MNGWGVRTYTLFKWMVVGKRTYGLFLWIIGGKMTYDLFKWIFGVMGLTSCSNEWLGRKGLTCYSNERSLKKIYGIHGRGKRQDSDESRDQSSRLHFLKESWKLRFKKERLKWRFSLFYTSEEWRRVRRAFSWIQAIRRCVEAKTAISQ